MVRMVILAAVLIACSCGGSCGRTDNGHDGDVEVLETDHPVDQDALAEDRIEETPDVPDLVDVDIPQEPEALDCVIPIRDCGEGCRQVTCAGRVSAALREAWDVSGSTISYYSRSLEAANGVGLYRKDLDAEVEARIMGYSGSYVYIQDLAMHDHLIVYNPLDTDDCFLALHVFDTASMLDETLFCYPENPFEDRITINDLDIYGSNIVWIGKDEGNVLDAADLFVYDLVLREKRRLTDAESCYNPSIWESTVACSGLRDSPDGSLDIILRDLETNTPVNVTTSPGEQDHASLWMQRLAWTDFRAEQCADIYWCDLPECSAMPATTDPTCQYRPAVEGDWIAWHDLRNDSNPLGYYSADHDNIELWGYNTETGIEYQLGSFYDLIGNKIRIENGRLYFLMTAVPNDETLDSLSVFEIDLSAFM
jgi:hypothetical protein